MGIIPKVPKCYNPDCMDIESNLVKLDFNICYDGYCETYLCLNCRNHIVIGAKIDLNDLIKENSYLRKIVLRGGVNIED